MGLWRKASRKSLAKEGSRKSLAKESTKTDLSTVGSVVEENDLAEAAKSSTMQKKDPYKTLVGGLKNGAGWNMYFSRRSHDFVISQLQENKCHKVLDVGCGLGMLVKELSDAGFECHGLDVSDSMLAEAKGLAPKEEHIYDGRDVQVCADLEGTFDAVHCALTLHELCLEDRDQMWNQMLRFVKPGGIILIRDYMAPSGGCISTAVSWFMHWEEEAYTLVDKAHFENYKDFLERGGVEAMVASKEGATVSRIAQLDTMQGNTRTIVCRRVE